MFRLRKFKAKFSLNISEIFAGWSTVKGSEGLLVRITKLGVSAPRQAMTQMQVAAAAARNSSMAVLGFAVIVVPVPQEILRHGETCRPCHANSS